MDRLRRRFFKPKPVILPQRMNREQLHLHRQQLYDLVVKEVRDNQIGPSPLPAVPPRQVTEDQLIANIGLPPLAPSPTPVQGPVMPRIRTLQEIDPVLAEGLDRARRVMEDDPQED